MKTFVRLIRRYVLTAVSIVLLFLFLLVALIVWAGWHEQNQLPQRKYSYSEIADSIVKTKDGLAFGPEHTLEEWMDGYAWV